MKVLKYGTSWDWLMPVVEKINKNVNHRIAIDVISENGFNFCSEVYASKYFTQESRKRIFCSESNETLIATVYNSVTAFIKWYNSCQPTQ